VSVDALMSSPEAAGLFDRAIAQSGFGREIPLAWEQALVDGRQALDALAGPDPTAEALRSLPAAEVARLPLDLLGGQVPVLDDVLQRSVAETFAAGEEEEVPFLAGTTDLEVGGGFPSPGPAAGRVRDLLLAELRPELLTAYGDQDELDRHLMADLLFTEPARHLVTLHSGPAYLYRFAIAPQPVLDSAGGAPHSSELAFVFDDVRRQGLPVEDAERLADAVADLWVDFATDGEPDGWPPADRGLVMTFTLDGAAAGSDPWAARLDLVQTGYERAFGP
jgi:para-nitrobenzyl esterase